MKFKHLFLALILPYAAIAQPEDKKARVSNIKNYLNTVGSFGYAGQVLLANKSGIMINHAYGPASRESNTPATNSTAFAIASVSKTITAVAILTLEMEGKLKVSDSLKLYFADCPKDKQGITIHQLLTHTSGISGGDMVQEYQDISKDALVKRILSVPLRTRPGTRWIYSNAGYNLLASIIEQRSGKEYGDYLQQSIFKPAGMKNTFVTGTPNRPVATGYSGVVSYSSPGLGTFNIRTWGGGSVCSTAEDLFSLCKALFNNTLLSAGALDKFLTKHTPVNNDGYTYYGYGCFVYQNPRDQKNIIDFTGETQRGFNCTVRMNLTDNETYVSVSNSKHAGETWNRWFLDAHIKNLWTEDRHFSMPPATATFNEKNTGRLTGVYKNGNSTLTIRTQGNNLVAEADGLDAVAMLYDLTEDDKRSYKKLEQSVAWFMDSYRSPGTEGFAQVMSDGQLKGFIDERDDLVKKFGAFKGYKIKGVFPDSAAGFLISPLTLYFENGETELFTMWNMTNAEKPIIDSSVPEEKTLIAKLFAPENASTFISYNFFKDRKDGTLRFTESNGKIELRGAGENSPLFIKDK